MLSATSKYHDNLEEFLRSRVPIASHLPDQKDEKIIPSPSSDKANTTKGTTNKSVSRRRGNAKSNTQMNFRPTMEHDFKGTGISWLQNAVLSEEAKVDKLDIKEYEDDKNTNFTSSHHNLSQGAKGILTRLLKCTACSTCMPGDGPITPISTNSSSSAMEYNRNNATDIWDNHYDLHSQSPFFTILKAVQSKGEVSSIDIMTNHYHKHENEVILLNLGNVPTEMDTADIVEAILIFLSCDIQFSYHNHPLEFVGTDPRSYFPSMPILTPSRSIFTEAQTPNFNRETSVYKYRVHDSWPNASLRLDDDKFIQKVINLERVFFASTKDQNARFKLCPRSDNDATERSLLSTGTIVSEESNATVGTKRKPRPAPKRKKQKNDDNKTTLVADGEKSISNENSSAPSVSIDENIIKKEE
mmetsp:Transcript_6303/g.9156  ORF Transcript_6303/g.9156 Transcript_6303/m.9156 type:complete len:414 (-) Transcript_6303:67-1308(-)